MAENVKQIQTYDGVIHDIEDETARSGLNNTYTKAEADALLANKVDNDEVYDKATLNSILDSKADEANVYSKTEADALLADKANAADVYTKTEADAALAAKADTATVDAALALKADAADVYTISQTDGLLAAKASIDDSTTTSTAATWSADKLNTDFQNKADSADVYTKAEVDALIGGIKMFPKLKWDTPLFTFTDTDTTYTAVKDCYLFGSLYSQSSASQPSTVSINGEVVLEVLTSNNVGRYLDINNPIPINVGDVVVVTRSSGNTYVANENCLKIYEEITS